MYDILKLEFEKMNVLYNISDFCLNMSYAEGFGLSTLECMMTGTPIVAAKTGGLTRQVINAREKGENGTQSLCFSLSSHSQNKKSDVVGSVPTLNYQFASDPNKGLFSLSTKHFL